MVKKYAVVGFISETGEPVEVIPSTWLINETSCFWPTQADSRKIKTMIKDCVPASSTWSKLPVKIYGYSNSFSNACGKAEIAVMTSNIGSDSSEGENSQFVKRKKRSINVPTRFRILSEPSSDDENWPPSSKKEKHKTLPISTSKVSNVMSKTVYALPEPPPEIDGSNILIEETSGTANDNESETAALLSSVTRNYISPEVNKQPQEAANMIQTPATSKETYLQKILKHLIDIKNENKEMKKEFKKLREKVEQKMNVIDNPQVAAAMGAIMDPGQDFPNLPLTTIPELKLLEEQITKDSSIATSLARFLCRGGGFNNENSLTLFIMKRLVSRDVAMQYSLEGRQGKFKFCDLNLFNIVIASVKMKFENAATPVISSRIAKALAGSADWDGNRNKRKKKKVAEIDESENENEQQLFNSVE